MNEEVLDFAAAFNVNIKMTSADAPWQNGIVERHHATADIIFEKLTTENPKMNPQELLHSAPRLSQSNRAYVILDGGDRGIIVPPGSSGKKITVRACDADGVQSGPVMKVSPKELRLEPLPAPPAPLRLAPWCVNCGSPAMLRCLACGSSICGVPGAEKWWEGHRPECRRLQAQLPIILLSNTLVVARRIIVRQLKPPHFLFGF